jgi:hypothetical protein
MTSSRFCRRPDHFAAFLCRNQFANDQPAGGWWAALDMIEDIAQAKFSCAAAAAASLCHELKPAQAKKTSHWASRR